MTISTQLPASTVSRAGTGASSVFSSREGLVPFFSLFLFLFFFDFSWKTSEDHFSFSALFGCTPTAFSSFTATFKAAQLLGSGCNQKGKAKPMARLARTTGQPRVWKINYQPLPPFSPRNVFVRSLIASLRLPVLVSKAIDAALQLCSFALRVNLFQSRAHPPPPPLLLNHTLLHMHARNQSLVSFSTTILILISILSGSVLLLLCPLLYRSFCYHVLVLRPINVVSIIFV